MTPASYVWDRAILHPDDCTPRNLRDYPDIYCIKFDICRSVSPKQIAEIGVRAGYSALSFLLAAPGATYIGFDANNGTHGGQGGEGGKWRAWAEELLSGRDVTFVELDTQTVDTLDVSEIDFFHVDGDHTADGVYHDLDLAFACLSSRGVILVDDMTFKKTRDVPVAVNRWLKKMRGRVTTKAVVSPRGELIIRQV